MCSIQDLINYLQIDSSKIPEEYYHETFKSQIITTEYRDGTVKIEFFKHEYHECKNGNLH